MVNPSIRILLVDNDSHYREALLKYFSKYPDFAIYEASNGNEGINTARQVEPDLILSEYEIPVLNGLEFCRRIRNTPETRSAIFIFLAHSKDDKDKVAAFQYGADDYIQKSTPPVILTSKITAFLRI
ncbi:MAG: response regulator, partial [Syntrophorhabdus sp.]